MTITATPATVTSIDTRRPDADTSNPNLVSNQGFTANTDAPRRSRARKDETIGGGFFVFRRGKRTGRIGAGNRLPYEHGSFEQAFAEATRLAAKHHGETFEVFSTTGAVATSMPACADAEAA